MAISIRFPFKETTEGGVFMSNVTSLQAIQTNLISLLTTKRKNRVMRSQLYSPLWDYIFELWDDISASKLKSELIDKINIFIPEVEISDIRFTFIEGENLLEVKVIYKALGLGEVTDEVSVVIPVDAGSAGADEHA